VDESPTGARRDDELGTEEPSSEIDSFLREVARISESPAPEQEDRVGQTLGHFEIARRLGAGGMGVVYAARDRKLHRKVALKVMSAALFADEERRRRFLREARSAASVAHPNIVTVFDVGEDGGAPFIAMEYVEGQSLRTILSERGGHVEIGEALRIGREIARGLGKAHAAGVVHRDIKPENVMVDADGAVKVLDFGIAKVLSADGAEASGHGTTSLATLEGHIVGTPSYMSPEQAEGRPIDARTDIFSLGIVLYEMISGVRPFSGATHAQVLISISRDPARPLREAAPSAPPDVERLIHRCLEKRREDRFQTCAELVAAMDALAAPEPPPGRAAGPSRSAEATAAEPVERTRPARPAQETRAPRRRLAIIAGALAVLALGAVAVGRRVVEPRHPAPEDAAAPLLVEALGCKPAALTGADTSQEVAAALGTGACARLASNLGIEWGLPDASPALEVKGDLRPDHARITLSIEGRSAEAEAATPVAAMIAAVAKLAEKLSTKPPSAEQIRDWGASDPESARRIRSAWYNYREGFSQEPLLEANRLLASDPGSAWTHAIVSKVDPARAESELKRAIELSDRLSPARAKALRGWLVFTAPQYTSDTDRQATALLQQAENERPDDRDILYFYADTITGDPRLTLASPPDVLASPRLALNLCNMVVTDPRVSLEDRGKALDRMRALLPESAVWSSSVQLLLHLERIEDARAAVALGERLGLGDADESRAILARATLDPLPLREAGLRMLRDASARRQDLGRSAVLLSHLMEGHVLTAERLFLERVERRRANGQTGEAASALLDELRLRRWLDRPLREAERVSWLEGLARAEPPALVSYTLVFAGVELPFARAGARLERAAAEKALARVEVEIEKRSESVAVWRDSFRTLAMPLLRAAKGDAEAARQWRDLRRAVPRVEPVGALDVALALEAAGEREEAERVHRTAMSTISGWWNNASNGFAMVAARVRLADLLRKSGQADEARKLDAEVERVWKTADPGLLEAVRKMR
jgi:tRNA A-37 threonylcarbamoyl transferase component Bud32